MSSNAPKDVLLYSPWVVCAELVLFILLLLLSTVGNGVFCFLVARNRRLGTVTNVLAVNLAIVNILDMVINVPLYLSGTLFYLPSLNNKTASWIIHFLYLLLSFLTLPSMLMLLIDRYLAVAFAFRYNAWKTPRKAVIINSVSWIVGIITNTCSLLPVYHIDLGPASLNVYRRIYFQKSGKRSAAIIVPIYLVLYITLSILTARAISETSAKIKTFIKFSGFNRKKKRHDTRNSKAAKTVWLILGVNLGIYVPVAIVGSIIQRHSPNNIVLHALAFLIFCRCLCNPIIYFCRSIIFRRALLRMIKQCSLCRRCLLHRAQHDIGSKDALKVLWRRRQRRVCVAVVPVSNGNTTTLCSN